MSKTIVAELEDGQRFTHTYDPKTVHIVRRKVCEGGEDTGVLDYVETSEVGRLENGKLTSYSTERQKRTEKCNPYAPVYRYDQ